MTPPPMDDGSSVWSGAEYSASTGLGLSSGYGGDAGDAGYPRSANSYAYSGNYPYYANYRASAGGGGQNLPPYWPQSPGFAPPVDGYAITAFVLGLLGFVPFAVGFAIAALRRIGQGRRRGRALAIAAIALSIAWVLIVAAMVAIRVADREDPARRDSTGVVTKAGNLTLDNIRAGDCLKLPAKLGSLSSVTAVPCNTLHNAQVFAVLSSSDASYPGGTALAQEGLIACRAPAQAFVSQSSPTTLQIADLVPTGAAWDRGSRTEVCALVNAQGNVTGDIATHA